MYVYEASLSYLNILQLLNFTLMHISLNMLIFHDKKLLKSNNTNNKKIIKLINGINNN